jgi:hypothetical protein
MHQAAGHTLHPKNDNTHHCHKSAILHLQLKKLGNVYQPDLWHSTMADASLRPGEKSTNTTF